MESDVPSVLYKYRGPERVDDLRSLQVRFTPPGEFNDPFEALVAVTGIFSPGTADELVEATHAEARKDGVTLDDGEVRAEFSFNEARATALAPEIISRLTNETFGVLSLAEPDDDVLMWGHYGAAHRGFLIGFDAHHPWFDHRETGHEVINHLRPIDYRTDRPAVYLKDGTLDPDEDSARLASEIFLRKSLQWRDEREWRIVRPLGDATCVDGHIHLFAFPPEALAEVVVGWRMGYSGIAAIHEVLDDPRLRHVRLRRARVSDTAYEMMVEDVTR